MALQGTLDTFELPDVLRLLSSTRKTGRLRLETDRGTGDVWLLDGAVVATEASGVPAGDVDDTFFDLLRARGGSFAFEPGEAAAAPSAPADVEALLRGAEERLTEWREIEAVVPSLAAWVGLAPELASESVTVDAAAWRLVATIGSGLTVGELGEVLGLGEVDVSRTVRDLVALGVAAVGVAPAHAAAPAAAVVSEPVEVRSEAEAVDVAPAIEPEPEPVADAAPVRPAWDEPMPPGTALAADYDVARQLAMLSPRAAEAVAAAAATGSDEDRDAALRALDDEGDDDEPVNRGLLLKFLGSVKS